MSINKNIISNVEWKKENNFHKVKLCINCKYCKEEMDTPYDVYCDRCTLLPNKKFNDIKALSYVCDKFKQRKGDIKDYDE